MGFRLLSLAVTGKPRDSVLRELGLRASGATAAYLNEEISGVQVGDWYVVLILDGTPFRDLLDDKRVADLSASVEVIACGVDEGTNRAFCAAWFDGRQTWTVVRDSNLAPEHLAVEGELPSSFEAIRTSAFASQAEDDRVERLMDVPLDLCADITGFRHDAPAADASRWDVLRAIAPTATSVEARRFMVIEDAPPVNWPFACQARAAIDGMTPDGGPGFVILENPAGDYMQTAGGDGAFLVEWREHEGSTFRHFTAGRHGMAALGEIRIPTNGAHVTARSNERLDVKAVKQIATAFLEGKPRPAQFAWRDGTGMFL